MSLDSRAGTWPLRGRTRATVTALTCVMAAIALTGCSLGDSTTVTGLQDNQASADFARGTGSPSLATKNTVRIPGAGPVADAAGAAISVFPAIGPSTTPLAVTLVNSDDWHAAVVAGVLMSHPYDVPILLGKPGGQYDVTKSVIKALQPKGLKIPGKLLQPKVLAFGNVGVPDNTPAERLPETSDPAQLAAQVDLLLTTLNSTPAKNLIVISSDPRAERYALPAGPLAAKTGAPVLFVNGPIVPTATLRALQLHRNANIFVVGPKWVVPDEVLRLLKRYGNVTRIAGNTPAQNSVAVAKYPTGNQLGQFTGGNTVFGWGANDPGHGLVIANAARPMDVAAATQLSVSGAYGPLLINGTGAVLDPVIRNYLLDIQPGYIDDPTRGVYNRAWLLGDAQALSPTLQAQVDALCEIQPIRNSAPGGAQSGANSGGGE